MTLASRSELASIDLNGRTVKYSCSIIIRAFNEERHIAKLLTGIRQQKGVDAEIIIVDSGSTDSTVAIAKHFDVKVVRIAPADFSFGRALNVGCEAARGRILVMASAHVYPVYRNWLLNLLKAFADGNVGLTYGRQVGNELTKYSEQRIFAKWFPLHCDANQQHPFCNNANAAVRTEIWQAFQYDERLTGLEDVDFGSRIRKAGWTIAYAADAPIVHVHEETPRRIYNRYRREAIAMHQIFPEERMSLFDFARLFCSNTTSDLFHAAYEKKFLRNCLDIPLFRLMQFWGAYTGFSHSGRLKAALRQRFYYPNSLKPPKTASHASFETVDYSQPIPVSSGNA